MLEKLLSGPRPASNPMRIEEIVNGGELDLITWECPPRTSPLIPLPQLGRFETSWAQGEEEVQALLPRFFISRKEGKIDELMKSAERSGAEIRWIIPIADTDVAYYSFDFPSYLRFRCAIELQRRLMQEFIDDRSWPMKVTTITELFGKIPGAIPLYEETYTGLMKAFIIDEKGVPSIPSSRAPDVLPRGDGRKTMNWLRKIVSNCDPPALSEFAKKVIASYGAEGRVVATLISRGIIVPDEPFSIYNSAVNSGVRLYGEPDVPVSYCLQG